MEILIWGCNDFSRCLTRFLASTSVQVRGFIEPHFKMTEFEGHKVLKPCEIKDDDSLANVPIVIAVPHIMLFKRPLLRMKSINQFKETLQEIIHQYQLSNELLHPVALIDFLDLSFPNKTILFGIQGSGNVIFTHIFQDLRNYFMPLFIEKNAFRAFFEMLCKEYMHIVHQVVTDLIHIHGGHEVRAVAWKVGTSHFNCKLNNNDECSIYSFATRDHIALTVPMYHQLPSQRFISQLIANQFKLFFVQRNPLDIILSGLNKSNAVDKNNQYVDQALFEATALWIIFQMNEWHSLMHNFTILKYEDLIDKPRKVIKTIMRKIGLLPINWLAAKIWKKHSFKQLPNTFQQHFWQGGVGKWERYFNRMQLIFLKRCGIELLLEKYGYLEISERFKSVTQDITEEECQQMYPDSYFTQRNICVYGNETSSTHQFLLKQHGSNSCNQNDEFSFVSHNTKIKDELAAIFDNFYVKQIAKAGAYSAFGNERIALNIKS